MSIANTHRPLALLCWFDDRSAWQVGIGATLAAGALGSIALPLGDSNAEMYRAAIQLWSTAITFGYVLAIPLMVVRRSADDLRRLAPELKNGLVAAANPFAEDRHPRALRIATLIGVAFGLVSNYLVQGSLFEALAGQPVTLVYLWGTPLSLVLWSAAFHAFWLMIDHTRQWAEIADRDVDPDLNRLHTLDVFPDVGARHLLLLVAGLAVFPIQGILAGSLPPISVAPAVAVVLPVAIFAFTWPMLAVRRAIQRAKRAELDLVDEQLREAPRLGERYLLLSLHRHHIDAIPAWPLKLRSVARLMLYLIIPPLAWVAAALVETVVSRFV